MKVTVKGQVTIPAEIRKKLGIKAHSEVEFKIKGTQVLLVKVKKKDKSKFDKVKGILKGKVTTDEIMNLTRSEH